MFGKICTVYGGGPYEGPVTCVVEEVVCMVMVGVWVLNENCWHRLVGFVAVVVPGGSCGHLGFIDWLPTGGCLVGGGMAGLGSCRDCAIVCW